MPDLEPGTEQNSSWATTLVAVQVLYNDDSNAYSTGYENNKECLTQLAFLELQRVRKPDILTFLTSKIKGLHKETPLEKKCYYIM